MKRVSVFQSSGNLVLQLHVSAEALDDCEHQYVSLVVIGHGIGGKDIPIMARLAKARRWSKQ